MLTKLSRNVLFPLADYGYLAQGRVSTPNILLHEAAYAPFHRFDITNSGLSSAAISYVLLTGDDDQFDLRYFWTMFENILQSGAGSREVINLAQFVDYIQVASELCATIQCLLGMKMIYGMDWEGTFNEGRPRELTIFGEQADLNDAAFDTTYEDVLREAATIKLPASLVNAITHFHSPFIVPGANAVHQFSVDPARYLAANASGNIYSDIDNLLDQLKGTPQLPTTLSVLHNFTPMVPIIGTPSVIEGSHLHMNALLNCNYGPADQTSLSIWETSQRDVADRNTLLTTSDTWSAVAAGLEFPWFDTTTGLLPVFSVTDSTDPEMYLYVPFYDYTGVGGGSYTGTCYNHGLCNYGDHFTLDSAGNLGFAYNIPNHQGADTAATAEASDLLDYLDIPNRHNNYSRIAINSVTRDLVYPEQVLIYKAHRDALLGTMFEIVADLISIDLGTFELSEITELSGIRARNRQVSEVVGKG
jgi:hypothetical protein